MITHFVSDHPYDGAEPDAGTVIKNHDYILAVDPSLDSVVRQAKEDRDAYYRNKIVNGESSTQPGNLVDPDTNNPA